MKSTTIVGILIFVWIAISYLILAIAGISFSYLVGSVHPFPISKFGVFGQFAQVTVRFVYAFLIAFVFFLILSRYRTVQVVTAFVFVEILAIGAEALF